MGDGSACRHVDAGTEREDHNLLQSVITEVFLPAVPSWLLEPIWGPGSTPCSGERRGGEPPEFHPDHPLRCHRRRVPDRVAFEHVIDALMHGSRYERIATAGCSDHPPPSGQWAAAGLAQKIHAVPLGAYDRLIGLELEDVSADGCITEAPCGGGPDRPVPGGPAHTGPLTATGSSSPNGERTAC